MWLNQVNKWMEWSETDLFIFQVLYRAVNYQMEPVGLEGESDATDPSLKVCTSPRRFHDASGGDGRVSFALFRLRVFPLLHISWSVTPVLWLLVSSHLFMPPPSPRPSLPPALWYLEWVLMFNDLHHLLSVCGWVLIWSFLLSSHCSIDVSTPLLCIFKPIYLSPVCVPYTPTTHVC